MDERYRYSMSGQPPMPGKLCGPAAAYQYAYGLQPPFNGPGPMAAYPPYPLPNGYGYYTGYSAPAPQYYYQPQPGIQNVVL
ncbi:hypothetical protein FRC02_004542 [Tulasnella sp. 418]|nr:hypothetical protein FRC02_004542 [Tulasnella sp. 418]